MKKNSHKILSVSLFLLSFSFFNFSTFAQNKVNCYLGKKEYQVNLKPVLGLTSAEAIKIVNEILEKDGKSPSLIKTQAAEVSNAEVCLATEAPTFRILFSPDFFSEIYTDTPESWANKAILAHEVGHIVNNDFINGDSGSTHATEIKADEYAGKMLARMGADLNQTLSAYRSKRMQDFKDSDSYPSSEKRVEAVKLGWETEKKLSISPITLAEKNAKELKDKFEELGNADYKPKPASFDLLGMKCKLEGLEVTKTEAKNNYECISIALLEEERKKFQMNLFDTVKIALSGEEYKAIGSGNDYSFGNFELISTKSNLKKVAWTNGSNEEGQYAYLRFLLTWNKAYDRPYFSAKTDQTIIDLGKEIETKISDLESAPISKMAEGFKLSFMYCSSDYNQVESEDSDSNAQVRVIFSCTLNSSFPSLSERKLKLRNLFSAVEYAFRARDYKWEFSQGDSFNSYNERQGERLSFTMPKNPIKNRLVDLDIFEETRYSAYTGGIKLNFIILK